MTVLTYAEQLKHPFWQRRRLQILERDGWACSRCGATEKTLHVHHKVYEKGRLAWDYPDADLMTACEDCHEQQHERDQDVRRLLAVGPTDEMLALCRGYLSTDFSPTAFLAMHAADPVMFAGCVAATLAHLNLDDAMAVARLVHTLFMAELAARDR